MSLLHLYLDLTLYRKAFVKWKLNFIFISSSVVLYLQAYFCLRSLPFVSIRYYFLPFCTIVFYWVLLGTIGYYWVQLGTIGYYLILLGTI